MPIWGLRVGGYLVGLLEGGEPGDLVSVLSEVDAWG